MAENAIDLFKFQSRWYLIITDYYSRYFDILTLKALTEKAVIKKCKKVFARFGIPEIVRTDPGTQFSTEFDKFAKEMDFKHVTSSPKYSQSNGEVESAVKIAKMILKKCEDVNKGLLSYRSTPLDNGYSPAELMFSRKIRSLVPMIPSKLGTFVKHEDISKLEKERKDKQESNYNKRHRAKKLSELIVGDKVWVIDKRVYAEVVSLGEGPNSYLVRTEGGGVIRRNRWHLIYAPYKDNIEVDVSSDNPVYLEEDNKEISYKHAETGTVNKAANGSTQDVSDKGEASSVNPAKEQSQSQRPKRDAKPNSRFKDFVCQPSYVKKKKM